MNRIKERLFGGFRRFRKEQSESLPATPPSFDLDTFNKMQFDQVYLYKYALVMACQKLAEFDSKKTMQQHFDESVNDAGAYIIAHADHEGGLE